VEIKVGGRWLSELAPWELGEWSTDLRGPDDLAWRMLPERPHPLLVAGALVEMYDAAVLRWSGRLDQPDLTTGDLRATGLYRTAYEVPALDGGGAPTSVANTAIDAAIARGALPGWKRSNFVSTTAMSADLQGEAPSIGDLLDVLADHEGKWWHLDESGEVDLFSRPAKTKWLVSEDAGALGFVEGDYASTIQGRRRSGASSYAVETVTDTSAAARFGPREGYEDLTHMGEMTSGRVSAVLIGQSTKGRNRFGFANSVTVTGEQLMTSGGVPAHLPCVKGGEVARFLVQRDQTRLLAGAGYVEEMLGKVVQHPQTRTAELQPADLAVGADFVDTLAWFAQRDNRKRRRKRRR